MVEMQRRTLDFYDAYWQSAARWSTKEEYRKWWAMAEGEITGRWGPVSNMVAIVMRRQAGAKRMQE